MVVFHELKKKKKEGNNLWNEDASTVLPFYSSRSDKLVKCDPFHICSQSVYAKDRLWASIFFLSLFCFTRLDVRSIVIRRRGRRRSEKLGFEIETVRRGKHEEEKKHGKKLHEWKIEIPPFHPRKVFHVFGAEIIIYQSSGKDSRTSSKILSHG